MQIGRDNNERVEGIKRIYRSLRYFIGENAVYPPGDILCISTKGNDKYDLFLQADGKSDFRSLYLKKATFPSQNIEVREEDDGQTLRVIVR